MKKAPELRVISPAQREDAIPTIWDCADVSFRAATIIEERLYRKQRLAAAFRLFARMGFELGASGHVTGRDPEWPDRFWVNPLMQPFSEIRVSDLLLVDHAGTVLEGEGSVNPAGFAIHSQLHAARPDVIAAAHCHSVYGKAWSAFGRPIEPLSQDAAIFYEDLGVFDTFSGMVEDLNEGQRIAGALADKNAVILKNHGILTVGKCVEAAVWRYVALENACHVQLLAQAAGGGQPIPHEVARHTHSQLGSDLAGVYSFEPYWQSIITREPEVLD